MRTAIIRLSLFALICLSPFAFAAERFVAPAASGDGRGLSPSGAASYLDAAFWASVGRDLASEPITVRFREARYGAGELSLTGLGHARNLLVLEGEGQGATFDAEVDILLTLKDCRNLALRRLHFTGKARKYGTLVIGSSSARPCEDIDIEGCSWTDLGQVFYGALGLNANVQRTTVRGCVFRRVGFDRHAHMMYNGAGARHLLIMDNLFEDCTGSYVRFRNRSDYGSLIGNTFRSSGQSPAEDSSTSTFIQVPLYNSYDPGTESFGTNFIVVGNRFEWAANPVKRDIGDPLDQANFHSRDAIRFHQGGFETRGYRTLLSKDDGYTLSLGAPSAKRSLLWNGCGINLDRITWYGNSYAGPMTQKAAYGCLSEFGAFPKTRGFDTFADITNALTQRELFRDGFEDDADQPGRWKAESRPGASLGTTFIASTEGRRSLELRTADAKGECSITRDFGPLEGLYFSAWFLFNDSDSDHVCLSDGKSPWIVAGKGGYWETGRGRTPSNATYLPGKWYHLEMVLEQGARNYSFWVDGVLVSKDIKDIAQGPVRSYPGLVRISQPAGDAGSMLVDDVQVASLGESREGAVLASARMRGASELELRFSAPMDCSEGARGAHSASNPLNYRVSRRLLPAYDIAPLSVTRESPTTFVLRLREPLSGDSCFVWTPDLRDESGRPLSPAGIHRRIEP